MIRNEKVYDMLKRLCSNITLEDLKSEICGFDATEIGERLDISRSNASKELNTLILEKKAIKISGKPVYYLDRLKVEEILKRKIDSNVIEIKSFRSLIEHEDNAYKEDVKNADIFDKFVGNDGSMEIPIKQAKSAILYPPRGLHTLLFGSTGVGKTMFAEMMYNYALQQKRIKQNVKFIVFNCAEYAENPQLIISQLFGHVKGAYTGADQDKAGLIEKANGGILLLDEIHRLPPEGQEMLFLLMDKNIYRRLGETENARKANVLLIAATTEDINSSLLKTFLRRIPVVIKLPSLSERPLRERYQLIRQFFCDQVKCTNVQIRVYKDVIKALLLYDCLGNIGQLKSDIQLICARGFLDYKTYFKKVVEVDTQLLPESIYNGLLNNHKRREEIGDLVDIDNNEYYEFTGNNGIDYSFLDDYNISEKIYKEINDKYYLYIQQGFSSAKINEKLNGIIEKYLKKLLKKLNVQKKDQEENKLFKIISPRVYYAVETALNIASEILKKSYTKKVTIALAMHISSLIERISEKRFVYNENLNKIAVNNPNEYEAAKVLKQVLEEKLHIQIPDQEIGFIAMFLNAIDSNKANKAIGVIVLAHGKSTASSIADVANNLLDTDICKAVDMPLDEKIDSVLEKVIEIVKRIDQGKGVLLMIDMGSLVAFEDIIERKTNINIRTIETISTPVVLEAVRKCLLPEMTLSQLVEDLNGSEPYMGRMLASSINNYNDKEKIRTIITTCVTGEGTAIKLSELLKNYLPIINDYNISIESMNITDVNRVNMNKREGIISVVGSVDLKIPGVPYIPIDEMLIGNGFTKLKNIINKLYGKQASKSDTDIQIPNLTAAMLENSLNFLNPIKAYNTINSSYSEIIKSLKIKDSEHFRISFLFHCCCMIERSLKKEPLPYERIDELIKCKPGMYGNIKKSLQVIEETFGTEIPDKEIGYLMDLVDTYSIETH